MTTVYELLRNRFDATAMRAAGGMYLIGRVFASGARLYLAAIAVSMIVFLDIQPAHVLQASIVLVVFGLVFTFVGGLRSVIWSDLVQVALYVGAALAVLWFLWTSIPASTGEIVSGLMAPPEGGNKLRLIDLSFDPNGAERSSERSIRRNLLPPSGGAIRPLKISPVEAGMLVHRNQSTARAAPT